MCCSTVNIQLHSYERERILENKIIPMWYFATLRKSFKPIIKFNYLPKGGLIVLTSDLNYDS